MSRESKRLLGPSPLWAKAPFVLLGYPGTLASVVLGAALLTVSVALFPLFLSRTTSDLVQSGIEEATLTRYGAGVTYRYDPMPLAERAPVGSGLRYAAIGDALADLVSESPLLDRPVVGAVTGFTQITAGDGSTGVFAGRLFTSTNSVQHIQPVGRGGGSGIWLPDNLASDLKVKPGGEVRIGSPESGLTIRVAGYYRALFSLPRTPYWHPWDGEIYPQRCDRGNCPVPPQFLIVDRSDFIRLAGSAAGSQTDFRWTAPIKDGETLTLDDARDLSALAHEIRRRTSEGRLEPLFQCCSTPRVITNFSIFSDINSDIDSVITDVEQRVATIQGPGQVLQAAGLFVALIVTVVAGIAAGAARRTESELMFVEGTGPWHVFAKTALESVLPAGMGGAVGFGLGVLLSQVLASSGPIAPGALTSSAERTALAVVAAMVLLATVAMSSFILRTEHHRTGLRVLTRVPWELAILVLAFIAFRRIQVHGAFSRDPVLDVQRPTFAILVFPILFIAGFATVAARTLTLALRRWRTRSGWMASWLYLGVHRLAGAGRLTVLMIAASALSLGIFVQGQALVGSLRDTVDAKAQVFVGSDVGGKLDYRTPYPRTFPFPLTRATRAPDAGQLQPGGQTFDLLAVDPGTIANAAYWNPEFSDVSLQDMAERLAVATGSTMPVVIVAGDGSVVTGVRVGSDDVPVRVVASASAFPGMSSLRPTIVASEKVLTTFLPSASASLASPNASTELWVKGDPVAASMALSALRFAPYPILTAEEVKDVPYLSAVIDTFVVLNLLGIAAALLVVGGILAFMQARQRSQLVSYGLSLRMGMTHARHRRSMIFELGFVLIASLVVAVVVALTAASLSIRHLDPFPAIPPSPLVARPYLAVAAALLGVLGASWAGAWAASRRARATDFGDVMRLAE